MTLKTIYQAVGEILRDELQKRDKRLEALEKREPTIGPAGTGIKAIEQEGDNSRFSLIFGDEAETRVEVELPRGEKGEKGDQGADGAGIEAQPWTPGVYREGVTVTRAFGKLYRATRDTAQEPGKSNDWQRIGSIGHEFKGLKQEGAEYEIGDMVIDKGSLFLHTGKQFKMICQRGRDGKKGDHGEKGAPGAVPIGGKLTPDGLVLVLDDGHHVKAALSGFEQTINALVEEKVAAILKQQAEDAKPARKRARR